MAKKKEFPKIMYIYKDRDGSNSEVWYMADEEIKNCANEKSATLVGIYELKELVNVFLEVKTEIIKESAALPDE